MKKIMIILGIAFLSNMLLAQDGNNSSSLTKKEKRKIEMEKQHQLTKHILENKSFVLEADFLQDKYGNRAFVSPTINFVAVDSSEAVIQIGSNHRIGPNGVGGVTAKGRISKWELHESKNSFSITMNVMTSIGIYDLRFSISPSGNATALLTGLRPGQLTFDGDVVPLAESSVYEGQSI